MKENYFLTNKDKKIKINLSLKKVNKEWKEFDSLQRILSVDYKSAENENINFFILQYLTPIMICTATKVDLKDYPKENLSQDYEK